jgi:hypothetical protein
MDSLESRLVDSFLLGLESALVRLPRDAKIYH